MDELSEIEKLRAENQLLKAEKKRQQMKIDLLKKTRRNREKVTLKSIRQLHSYIAIKELSTEHPEYSIRMLCEMSGINRAAYYKWKNHKNSENDDLNERIADKIMEIHKSHPDMGDRRIRDTLKHDHEIDVNDKRVMRVCRKKKVQSYIKHRYNYCTKPASDPAYIAENVLDRDCKSERSNEKWLTDVSEFKYGTSDDEKRKRFI